MACMYYYCKKTILANNLYHDEEGKWIDED